MGRKRNHCTFPLGAEEPKLGYAEREVFHRKVRPVRSLTVAVLIGFP